MHGQWIWCSDSLQTENERVCFVQSFELDHVPRSCDMRITAVSRYVLYCNGSFVGCGPIRSASGVCYFDTYGLDAHIHSGINHIAVHVWNYGWSNYQALAGDGSLLYDICADGMPIAVSGSSVRAIRDSGHIFHAPKRNVNLGFTDYYDSQVFPFSWIAEPHSSAGWPFAEVCLPPGEVHESPVKEYSRLERYPKRIVRFETAADGCQVVSVNTRRAFFGSRTDADETTMNGLLGCTLRSQCSMSGTISFPNKSWNGMLGSFRLGSNVYTITDSIREAEVVIPAGDSLFLIQFNGQFDDLYCHIEFRFPTKLSFAGAGSDRCFFVIGPTRTLTSDISGRGRIVTDMPPLDAREQAIFECDSLALLERVCGNAIKWVAHRDIMFDMYLLSLNRLAKIICTIAPREADCGVLWKNSLCTTIIPASEGQFSRLILDLGDMSVGNLDFTVFAEAGTVLDFYFFENMYQGEIDFTTGLNNGIRYICREGWQRYRAMARMGGRYILVSVRNSSAPVKIRDLHIDETTYATSRLGSFQCSDEKLNRIWEMCAHTHELCLEDCFTDCPTYEQAFWLGDAQISAAVNAYICGDYTLCRHSLVLAASASANTPLLNALTPTDWRASIPLWAMNWVAAVYQYVELSGDRTLLTELYGDILRMLDYYCSLLTPDGGFLVSAWNLVDWAPLDISSCCIPTAYQGILSYCLLRFSQTAHEFGKPVDADRFSFEARRTREFLNRCLWDEDRGAFRDSYVPGVGPSTTFSLQTHSLLWLYDVIDGEDRRTQVLRFLSKKPDDFIDVGSPFMLCYLYECLASVGQLQTVFDDIKSRWGEMLRFNSATCWEVFPGFYENSRTRSYCHAWSASPAMLMQKYLLGVRLTGEGCKTLTFGQLYPELDWCRGTIPCPSGLINVEWDREQGKLLLQLPVDISVTGEVPEGFTLSISRTK